MKKYILILGLVFNKLFLFSQNGDHKLEVDFIRSHCCASLNNNDDTPIEPRYLIDKIIKENKSLAEYISNRKKLQKFETKYCSNDEVIVEDSLSLKLELNVTSKTIKTIDHLEFNGLEIYRFDTTKIELSKFGKTIYGFGNFESEIKIFKDFKVKINNKDILVPDSAICDLFFPNFCEIDNSIRPIEAYESINKKNVYIYIFGLHKIEKYDKISFMCKLIFNKEEYVGRIISDLNNYKWKMCENFIGF